jgi:opacity protein-like surface antigen
MASGAVFALLGGSAIAQTADTSTQAYALPSSTLATAQSTASAQQFGTGDSHGTAYGLDLGKGFRTEIEGLSSSGTSARLGGVAAAGSLTTARVTLKGMYEFRDGEWRLKPYVGAGFGVVDVNEHVLGAARNDWNGAYQLRGGVTLGFTQKLLGSLEYRWAMGSKPHFSLAGIPTKLEVDRHGFVLGINYKY